MENQLQNQLVTVQETTSKTKGKPEVKFYPISPYRRPNTRQKSSELFESFFGNPGLYHIGQEILLNLDVQSLVKCKRVNKTWNKIIDSPNFWIKWGARLIQKFYGYHCQVTQQHWFKTIETEKENTKKLMERCRGYENFCYQFLVPILKRK